MKKLLSGIVLALALLATGCSSSGTSGDPSAPNGQATTTPVQGGIVRTTMSSEPDHLDPYLSAAADTEAVMMNVFEGLMRLNEKGELVTQLASNYTISEDGLTYTFDFDLTKNITFHNDTPMTMEDVIYSYRTLAGLDGDKALSSKFKDVKSIDQVDDDTVTFTLGSPDAAFLAACTEPIVPRDYKDQEMAPIGTGPFKFKSYVPGQKLVLENYPSYYDESRKGSIDEIEFRIMSDENSILMALKSGELDIAQINPINVPSLEKDYDIISTPQNMVQIFAMNHDVKPFDDKRVRQAINYAIDKDLIIQGVVSGYGTKLYTNASPVSGYWYNDLSSKDPYPYNVDQAKALLAEAGYPNGFETTLKVPSNYQTHIDTAQVLADMLGKVGIKVNIELVEWGQWLEQVYTGGNYDTTLIGLAGKADPHEVFVRYESTYAKNFYHFKNADYDALIAKGIQETNSEKRLEIYKAAQQFLADEAVGVYIMDPHLVLACKKDLKGYTPYPVSFFDASKLQYTGQ